MGRREFIPKIIGALVVKPLRSQDFIQVEVRGEVTRLRGSSFGERYQASFSFPEGTLGAQPSAHFWEYGFDHERDERERFDSPSYIEEQLDSLGQEVCLFARTFSYEIRPSPSGAVLVLTKRRIMH